MAKRKKGKTAGKAPQLKPARKSAANTQPRAGKRDAELKAGTGKAQASPRTAPQGKQRTDNSKEEKTSKRPKYVGNIFMVNNRALGIRRSGGHFVHITWYNPHNQKFRCKIITSLEDVRQLTANESKADLGQTPYVALRDNTFALFDKRKYKDLRFGKIIPIPANLTEGFDGWVGYTKTIELDKKALKYLRSEKQIKKPH